MQKPQIFNQVTGMNRDLSPSKRNSTLAYDIKNMRLTAEGDSTTLAWSTEKGTQELTITGATINGTIVGCCSLNNYIILFTKVAFSDTLDRIYRIEVSGNTGTSKMLFQGSLGLGINTALDTITVYENESIQKVYWTDGINQPRFLNIAEERESNISDVNELNFLPTSEAIPEIKVTKKSTVGYYKAGTIQYALVYYNKNGAQTNIVCTTPINYISDNDKGTLTDKLTNCSFDLCISNLDYSFDFVRIYSIVRNSEDTAPAAYKVADLNLDITDEEESVYYTDDGSSLETVDYSSLLFMNNSCYSVETFAQKDNTLFLGGIEYKSNHDIELKTIFANTVEDLIEFVEVDKEEEIHSDVFYPYKNQLNNNQADIAGFKANEAYLFGLVFLDKYNRQTSVIPIGNLLNTLHPKVSGNTITIVQAHLINRELIGEYLDEAEITDYKAFKVVYANKDAGKRNVLCQGIVCPTVYSVEERINGTLPYAQSSWFFRPALPTVDADTYTDTSDCKDGFAIESNHFKSLSKAGSKSMEIQSSTSDRDNAVYTATPTDNGKFRFGVDTGIVTLHSPDIEFDASTKQLLSNSINFNFRIAGFTTLHATFADSEIQTSKSSYAIGSDTISNITLNINKKRNDLSIVKKALGQGWYTGVQTVNTPTGITNSYKIFPWNRSTTADYQVEQTEEDSWHFPITKKCLSNIRVCKDIDFSAVWKPKYGITNIGIFEATTKLLKLKDNSYRSYYPEITYYGNVDTMVTCSNYDPSGTSTSATNTASDPIRMKYSSTDHAVLAFSCYAGAFEILPYIGSGSTNLSTKPVWTSSTPQSGTLENIRAVIYYVENEGSTGAQVWKDLQSTTNPNLVKQACISVVETLTEGTNSNSYILNMNAYKSGCCTKYSKTEGGNIYTIVKLDTNIAIACTIDTNYYVMYLHIKYDKDIYLDDVGRVIQYTNCEYTFLRPSAGYVFRDNSIKYGATRYYTIKGGNDKIGQATLSNTAPSESSVADRFQIKSSQYGSYTSPGFFVGELYRDEEGSPLDTKEGKLQSYQWNNASNFTLVEEITKALPIYGDTYFQRYDCLKTYATNDADVNQIVDIASFYVETHINIDGRYDSNRGSSANNYMNNQNFNLINKAYSQLDRTQLAYLTDDELKNTKFSNSLTWSLNKVYGETIDSWTRSLSTSLLDLDGDKGAISKIINYNGALLAFQKSGFSQILYNERSQLASNTGIPIELANSGKVDGKRYISNIVGCSYLKSITIGKLGVYFVDSNTDKIYLFTGEGMQCLSEGAFETYLKGKTVGMVLSTDPVYGDVYFKSNLEALAFNEQMKTFTSFYDYTASNGTVVNGRCFDATGGKLYEHHKGEYGYFYTAYKGYHMTVIANGDGITDKTFNNIEFRATTNDATKLPFDGLEVENEYQTGSLTFNSVNLRKKFRIWRALFPRAKYNNTQTRDRIRNPWVKVKLFKNPANGLKTTLHDEIIYYI